MAPRFHFAAGNFREYAFIAQGRSPARARSPRPESSPPVRWNPPRRRLSRAVYAPAHDFRALFAQNPARTTDVPPPHTHPHTAGMSRCLRCIAPQGLRGRIGHLREKDLILYIPASCGTRLRDGQTYQAADIIFPAKSRFFLKHSIFCRLPARRAIFPLKPIPKTQTARSLMLWRLSACFGDSSNFLSKIYGFHAGVGVIPFGELCIKTVGKLQNMWPR